MNTATRVPTSVLQRLEALLAKEASLRGTAEPHSLHEADATARAVQRLLLRYHLAMTDVQAIMADRGNPVGPELWLPDEHGLAATGARVHWQEELAATVARAHLCALLVVPGSNALYFVGRPEDRKVAGWAFGMLARFADAHSRREARAQARAGRRAWRTAWLRGFNVRIAQRYREHEAAMVRAAMEQNAVLGQLPGGTGIATTDLAVRLTRVRGAADAWVREHVRTQGDSVEPEDVMDLAGLQAGYAAGSQPSLTGRAALEA